ncbi:nitroreductase family protein [Aliagarivorans marinus]|uniref:nitroreductase family protein n=1 Tax=Aliagarivorans marinus TaxID=561965 RepID=UPI0006855820|nr:nitroreductase family protein [Aliagarivorans marinus]
MTFNRKRYTLRNFKRIIKTLLAIALKPITHFMSRSQRLSKLYFSLFSSEFKREQHAVLSGHRAYQRSLHHIGDSSVLLRRNIHRLEKGLIMRPRRSAFGKDYLNETLDCYSRCLNAASIDRQELQWAYDVLTAYFSVVDLSLPWLDKAYKRFCALREPQKNSGYVPYRRSEGVKSETSFEQFLTLCQQRRSVRWYQEKAVSMKVIEQAVQAASLAPSACNRQPFRFYTALQGKHVQDIASIAMGTAGFIHNIPAVIVVVGDLSAYPFERDRHVIYIDGSLAAMQLMLALETMGLSTCPINWPDIEEKERSLSLRLGLKPYERPIMLISVGYPDPEGMIPYSHKKSPSQLIKEVL